tara:strand:+ start:2648 stop:3118 length:471 start_codon:yes stop_codon:yes gene_type:complete
LGSYEGLDLFHRVPGRDGFIYRRLRYALSFTNLNHQLLGVCSRIDLVLFGRSLSIFGLLVGCIGSFGLRVGHIWGHVRITHGGTNRHALQIEVGRIGGVVGRTVGFGERSGSCRISFFGSTGIDGVSDRYSAPLGQLCSVHVLGSIFSLLSCHLSL